ncbi:DUF4870 domain-containing protein [Mucilaginibacter sp. Bleaf8]|uniref:DUF4870 domain-containing protein n=1 Tax=Mucilaginibacter sp. Bleaf8 TaxID=2834430 RepID=UPI001BD02D2B|nr:DUF4870 domain-containing protein [Mucilaginibacter sp. Bleaf8]MBS7566400.1 DUF4870 domain-containing protein [Mucilaginibacter sp. Bleaf8]
MSKKTMAVVAYITIIGWVVSYLEYKKSVDKSPLVNYHLGQSLGLIILSFALGIVMGVLVAVIPGLYIVSYIISILSLVLLLMGVIAANNEAFKPLPIVGRLFEGKFDFSKS